MSFSSEVKKELLNIEDLTSPCCKKAFLYGILQGNADLMISSLGFKVVITSMYLNVLKVVIPLLKELYSLSVSMSYKDEVGLEGRRFYSIEIMEHADDIIQDFKLMPFQDLHLHDEVICKECCKRAFVRGLFVAKGSMNNPRENAYHYEISSSKQNVIHLAFKALKHFGIECKETERRNQYVVYVKKSEAISDTLALMGATSGVFYFQEERIRRDYNNMVNRVTNCDIANEVRCAKTCDEQLNAIKYIRDHGLFDKMPARLQTTAILREENPDASLGELALYSDNYFGKELSKSGMSHCMRALMNYYHDLVKKEKEC